jgi:hypothetical protein
VFRKRRLLSCIDTSGKEDYGNFSRTGANIKIREKSQPYLNQKPDPGWPRILIQIDREIYQAFSRVLVI